MKTIRTLTVSSIEDALDKALKAFSQGEEFVLCQGDATVGGVMFAANGTLLLHRSKRGVWLSDMALEQEIEAAKQRLLEEV